MNTNTELLNYIYQNASMGVESMEQLVELTEDDKFRNHLEKQKNEYTRICDEACKILHNNGDDEKDISTFTKIRSHLMINIQTLTDKSTTHIAEMLIIGSNMGVIEAIKKLKEYKDADEDIRSLMDKLLCIEENNITVLKKFLAE